MVAGALGIPYGTGMGFCRHPCIVMYMVVSRNRDLLSAAQLSWAYRIPFLFGVFEMFLACRIFRFREKRKKIVENPGNVITSCLPRKRSLGASLILFAKPGEA